MVDEKKAEQPFQGYAPGQIAGILENITDPRERAEKEALLKAFESFGKGLDIIEQQKKPKA